MGEKWYYTLWRSIKHRIRNELGGAWLTKDELEKALSVVIDYKTICGDYPCAGCRAQSLYPCQRFDAAEMLYRKLVP